MMRSIDDQMKEIRRRKDIYNSIKMLRRKMLAEISTCLICGSLMVVVLMFTSRLESASEQSQSLQYGSSILTMPNIGYVLIAIIAFILGVAVTLLCIHWKKRKNMEQEL